MRLRFGSVRSNSRTNPLSTLDFYEIGELLNCSFFVCWVSNVHVQMQKVSALVDQTGRDQMVTKGTKEGDTFIVQLLYKSVFNVVTFNDNDKQQPFEAYV